VKTVVEYFAEMGSLWPDSQKCWALRSLWGQWTLLGLHRFWNGAEIRLYELCFMLICLQNPSRVLKDARQEENPSSRTKSMKMLKGRP